MQQTNFSKTSTNANEVERFHSFINQMLPAMQKLYTQRLIQDLAQQQWENCFARNVIAVMEQTYAAAYTEIERLPFDLASINIENGLSELTKPILAAFTGFVDNFLLFVVDKHRTSCALSNFPAEHKPNNEYVNAVKREIAELWQNFALDINAHFLQTRSL